MHTKAIVPYEIAIRSRIVYLRSIIVRYAILFLFCWAFYSQVSGNSVIYLGAGLLFVVFVLVDIVPFVVLHHEYYNLSKNMHVVVDEDHHALTVSNQHGTHSISFDHIQHVNIVQSYGGDGSWSGHKYAILRTKEGNEFIITSLLISNLLEFFNTLGVATSTQKKIFPFIGKQYRYGSHQSAA